MKCGYFLFWIGMVWAQFSGRAELIRLSDSEAVRSRAPLLIAHRGGVVTESSPECSATAIRRAAADGYAMVELDVQASSDGIPMVFHDRTLEAACGVEGRVADHSVEKLEAMTFVDSGDSILPLDKALGLCRELELGVMLDLKVGRDDRAFLRAIDGLIERHGLSDSVVSFSGSEAARSVLKHVMMTATDAQLAALENGEDVELEGTFWFGLPSQLPDELARRLLKSGAYVFPAINTFRYPDATHMEMARRDVERLLGLGVDGFQIDSVYRGLFVELAE